MYLLLLYLNIYKFSLKKNEKVLVIGDNLNTDIKGANKMGFDCLLITGGIHKKEFFNVNEIEFKKILNKYDVNINYFQTQLTWES